jgi:glutathione S-transferase
LKGKPVFYMSVREARALSGLRLVLSAGVPGPWGEASRNVFDRRNVTYVPVIQRPGDDNSELRDWTGDTNAPQAVYESEAPVTRWDQILFLAERIGRGASLIPEDPLERLIVLGLGQEICGQQGFGWNRRLEMLEPECTDFRSSDTDPVSLPHRLARRYGYRSDTVGEPGSRMRTFLHMLGERLRSQHQAGSPFLVGKAVSAADVYWACFAYLISPLEKTICSAPDGYIAACSTNAEETRVLLADYPELLGHRDMMYRDKLRTPVDV